MKREQQNSKATEQHMLQGGDGGGDECGGKKSWQIADGQVADQEGAVSLRDNGTGARLKNRVG